MAICCWPSSIRFLIISHIAEPGTLALVTEWMSYSLEQRLIRERLVLSMFDRVKLAKDAALGMQWMHNFNPPMLHRNLRLSNLLVKFLSIHEET